MTVNPGIFPDIPQDTARSARTLFGLRNIYIKIGEQAQEILYQFNPEDIAVEDEFFAKENILLAMMSVFQIAEGLGDHEIVEAIGKRVDLKYALHLPLHYPRIDPRALCKFRKMVFNDPAYQVIFQSMLDKFIELGLFEPTQERPIRTSMVLEEICSVSQMEVAHDVMVQALEVLVVKKPDWMRRVILPEWFIRYNHGSPKNEKNRWQLTLDERKNGMLEILKDMHYLLQEIDRSGLTRLNSIRPVEQIRLICEKRFAIPGGGDAQLSAEREEPKQCGMCWMDYSP